MKVCVISFSSRKNGNCTQIGDFVGSMYPDTKRYDFSNFKINACGQCSYQCFANGSHCPNAHDKEREMLDAITSSDLTIFVVPNYCDYPCSNYFVFNERSLCYFQGNESLVNTYLNVPKKFIVISNSNQDNFRTAFAYQTNEKPKILFLSSKKYGQKSIDGNLLSSPQAMEDLKRFVLN